MSKKTKESLKIVSQERIGKDIYSMWLQADHMAAEAKPGQFLSLYTRDGSKLLPRPISICEIDRENGRIRLVYRVTGKNTGTEAFSRLHAGVPVEVLGPLGNGFPLHEAEGKRVFLMGGGIGIPPMLQTAKELNGTKTAILGYRDELFLNDACGPTPMLRAIKAYAEEKNIPCWISMEERMACGVGACLACVCKSKEIDSHSHVHNKRICKDGPVFLSTEVEL